MKRLLVVFFVIAAFSVVFTPVASAQRTPRAVPPNDSFASATPLMVGKNYKVPDIGAATLDPGQPVVSSCATATNVYHSVWYTITVPYYTSVYLTTRGSVFYIPDNVANDTVLAVYTGPSIGSLTQIACNDDANSLVQSALSFFADPNIVYHVAVGTFSNTAFLPNSELRLTSHAASMYAEPNNASFEAPLTNANWKVKNPSGDGPICGNVTYTSYSGTCAFRFVGNPGESSTLSQTFPFPSYFVARKGAAVVPFLYFRVMDTGSLGSAKITYFVNYSDGTPSSKQSVNLAGRASMGSYNAFSRSFELASKNVSSIKYKVNFESTSGTLMLDYALLTYAIMPAAREAAAFPLPAPK